jgi:phosphatidylglycerol:prolipoprotein diacylglycerol transferase
MLPKLIEINSFFLPTYGVIVAIAFLAAIAITTRLARRVGLSPEKITNLAIYCAIAGMVGAKLFMFLFDWKLYAADPSQLFTLSTLQAAGVYQGGFLIAVLTAVLYARRNALPGFLTLDVFAPGVALGHAIGRLGCFAAGCCWGAECDRPWAVTFRNPQANELTGVPLGIPLHPTQLYESAAELVIFGFLLWYFRRIPREGSVIGCYLVL